MKTIPFLLKFILPLSALFFVACNSTEEKKNNFTRVKTIAGINREFGEPFGIAFDEKGTLYVSDGEQGKIKRVSLDGKVETVTDKFQTPSAIAFDKEGFLLVADSGASLIKRVNVTNGDVAILAGVENQQGFADGEVSRALFNAPIGIAIAGDGKIYVADTYNDRIRVIENGKVSTIAGGERGFADSENGLLSKFDTPSSVAILKDGSLIVADTANRRLRRIEANGKTTTLAGDGEQNSVDGFPLEAKLVEPTTVAVDKSGALYVTDGNSIRVIGKRFFPFLETISNEQRGLADGRIRQAKFNRPSGLAFDKSGNLFVADSENQTVRVLTGENLGREITQEEITDLRYKAEEFRALQPPRWTFDPPNAKRDIAGTLGEIRGEITEGKEAWFHNGLDIAGGYGETAKFIRAEKVLRPLGTENFGGLRELLRMPTIGYIHLRLGREKDDKPFGDSRFQFNQNDGKLSGVRIPRGTKFEAGDAIGTLNAFNHVHLIAGRTGAEMNALDALVFPNISDNIPPKIEKVSLFDEHWSPLEAVKQIQPIKLSDRIRVVVRAFDQMDGNAARRKLGIYRLGYQILKDDKTPLFEPKWTISFSRMPDQESVKLVYATGSRSGYSPETVFNYIVTNELNIDRARENYLDLNEIQSGNYVLRVLVSDFFGNISTQVIPIEIK